MRLAWIFAPARIALMMSVWPRFEIEDAVERLIEVLDTGDALLDDATPDDTTGLSLLWSEPRPDAQV